jgi:hypothetical protein
MCMRILYSVRYGCEVGFKFHSCKYLYGDFAMVGWYRMGPDFSVMQAKWQAVSRTLGIV